MGQRYPTPTLFLYTVTLGLFVLGIYFVFTTLYSPAFLPAWHHLAHARSQEERPPSRNIPFLSSIRDQFAENWESSTPNSASQSHLFSENPKEDKSVGAGTDGSSGLKNKSRNLSMESLTDPHKGYVLRSFSGRLGNSLFEFASAFCIAKLNNMTLIIKDTNQLKDLRYQGIRLQEELWTQLSNMPQTRHSPNTCCSFDSKVMTLKPADTHHAMHGYSQSWRYFEPCKTQVKQAILFTDSVISTAISIVTNLREKLPHRTLVGVHVRMGDYLTSRAVNNGKKIAPPEYYRRAMAYFRSRFSNVTFVVSTAKPDWFRNNVTQAADVMMLRWSSSPAVDMEVLSRMDHVIFSVGTFGWWIAYKNNGTVVCYSDFHKPDTKYGRQFLNNSTDFIYPGWIRL